MPFGSICILNHSDSRQWKKMQITETVLKPSLEIKSVPIEASPLICLRSHANLTGKSYSFGQIYKDVLFLVMSSWCSISFTCWWWPSWCSVVHLIFLEFFDMPSTSEIPYRLYKFVSFYGFRWNQEDAKRSLQNQVTFIWGHLEQFHSWHLYDNDFWAWNSVHRNFLPNCSYVDRCIRK